MQNSKLIYDKRERERERDRDTPEGDYVQAKQIRSNADAALANGKTSNRIAAAAPYILQ